MKLEIATDEHYVLNGEKYLVNFEYMGQEVTTVSIDCGQFVNELKRGKIKGIKVNESDEPLENAVFGLFAVDIAEFTSQNAYMTAVSDENGYFEFTEIPYGEYIVREIKAPTGYILSDERYPVTVCEDGETITVRTINKPITVEVSKVDVYGEELIGAEMQLIDSEGNVVEEWISTDEAHFIEGKLIAGKEYTLRETIAPEGYEIANEIRFTVNADGSVTEVVMYDELTPKTTTPYTGDNHSNFAAYALMGASLIIFLVLIISRKKNDDKEPEDHSALCPDFIEIDED